MFALTKTIVILLKLYDFSSKIPPEIFKQLEDNETGKMKDFDQWHSSQKKHKP